MGDAYAEAATLLEDGRLDDAAVALEQAVEREPEATAPLVDLAHCLFALGRVDEALDRIEAALALAPGDPAVVASASALYGSAGQEERAYALAEQRLEATPDDVSAALDVAERALALDRLDDAVSAFARVRAIDDVPEHEIYAYHGQIEAELRRKRWRRALDLAVDATRVDRHGRTTDVLAFVVAQVFGAGERPAPPRQDVLAALAESRREHRLLHGGEL
jgi:tetratricopeptide (TPR) repeat protein